MLDDRRRKDAQKRIDSALRDARYHESQRDAALAKAQTIARVWGLELAGRKETSDSLDSDRPDP